MISDYTNVPLNVSVVLQNNCFYNQLNYLKYNIIIKIIMPIFPKWNNADIVRHVLDSENGH